MNDIQHLLKQVKIISNKNVKEIEETGGRFNMFRICKVNHYENTNSAIIAEFLNPKGSHNMKSKLLECFIETLGADFIIDKFNCKAATVYTEYKTDDGRIDILIKDNQDKAIIIENKIYAGDQWEQLKRYNAHAEKKFKGGYQILYLTLDGCKASDNSGKDIDYLTISYEKTIIRWLEKCVEIEDIFPVLFYTIKQYTNHLKQLTDQEMDKKEIRELLSKPDFFESARIVYMNYEDTIKQIIKDFVPKIMEISKNLGLTFQLKNTKDEKNFWCKLTYPDWNNKMWIEMKTQDHIQIGLVHNPENKISEDYYNKLKDKLEEKFKFITYHNNNWIFCYKTFYEKKWANLDDFVKETEDDLKTLLSALK